ncbi:hypothetical protein B0A54_04612 [Friedmanniomyces endolithicus]|uniref:NTF2 domain-containing protein n=1 Tax=Friedmanniomyces endolithicus TaxID=329885 RepID=A0A4U0V8E2_9PEZI|nr:hypothetical protein LTS09_008663 [Friedmanniomyces endolithicus]TKA44662.1 hypothetical protein B0A54_04612 [Friedmanniomyces endolithicus]
MASQYTAFLNNPTAAHLASDASLVYVTTTTEIKEANAIIKHLQAQQKQAAKKGEKILNVIASQDGACLETEITLQFKAGGGAYLPGVDENLLDEKIVTFPLMHIVRFDSEQKIKQIRLYWDQGTLLKQVDAIGKTGRNWPIKDGQAQVNSINRSLNAGGRNTDLNGSTPAARGPHDVVIQGHKKRDSVTAVKDPHASLALFAPRDPNEDSGPRQFEGPKTAPRESYKAQPRGLDDILSGEETAPTGSTVRSPSPTKMDGSYAKAGAGKHHVNNRLFDENEPSSPPRSPERKKVFMNKQSHFEFGDGEDAAEQNRPMSARGNKKAPTQIDFASFSVSPSVEDKSRPDYDRHWGDGVQPDESSPVKRPIKHAPRVENESHFSIANSSPAAVHEKSKSLQRQKGMGLYQDPLHADERTAVRPVTNTNNSRRGNDFAPQHTVGEGTPSATEKAKDNTSKNMGSNMSAQTRGDLDSNWDFGTPIQEKKVYKTAGNGMGGREAGAGSGSKHKRKRVLETTGLNAASEVDEQSPLKEARLNVTYWPIGEGHEIALMDEDCRRDSVIVVDEMILHDVSGSEVKRQKTTSERAKDFLEQGSTEPEMVLSGDDAEK